MSRGTFKVLLCLAVAAVSVRAQAAAYGQCGGVVSSSQIFPNDDS
jgi:hypothetical protein